MLCHCQWPWPSSKTWRVSTIHCTNVGSMLGQRLQRWPNIVPTLVQCIVFAGFGWHPRDLPFRQKRCNITLRLGHCLRRWPNLKTQLRDRGQTLHHSTRLQLRNLKNSCPIFIKFSHCRVRREDGQEYWLSPKQTRDLYPMLGQH